MFSSCSVLRNMGNRNLFNIHDFLSQINCEIRRPVLRSLLYISGEEEPNSFIFFLTIIFCSGASALQFTVGNPCVPLC